MADYTTAELAAISNLGLFNSNRYEQSLNPFGFAGEGYKTNAAQAANDTATVANAVKRQADIAKSSADVAAGVAVNAPTTNSNTSLAISSSGSVTFTCTTSLQTVSPFRVGQWVKAMDPANPTTKWVWGQISAINVTLNTLTLARSKSAGSGTVANWYLIATGPDGPATGIASVQADTAPKLGGDFFTNSYDITVQTGDLLSFASDSQGIDMNYAPIAEARLLNFVEGRVSLGSISNNVTPTGANHFKGVLAGNITPILPTTLPAANSLKPYTLTFRQAASGGPYGITWPASVKWIGGTAPTMSTTPGATDKYALFADLDDSGNVVYAGVVIGQGWLGL